MLSQFHRTLRRLARHTGGNAAMLVAAGMPALIGAAGLGVDTAQWYMWQREMQYATDQAALAGAWAKIGGVANDGYKVRAKQEMIANVSKIGFDPDDFTATSSYWDGAKIDATQTLLPNNSVVVSYSMSRSLPFSSFLMSNGVTISTRSVAVCRQGRTFTSCLIAVDPHTRGAIVIGGNAYVVAGCGAAALSDDPEAVIKNGNATFNVGWIVSEGGIDDAFNDGKTQVYENQSGLTDPFANLTPPDNPAQQTLTCGSGGTKYIATVSVVWKYYSQLMASPSGNGGWKTSGSQVFKSQATGTITKEVTASTAVNSAISPTSTTTEGTAVPVSSGNKTTYQRTDTITEQTGTITKIDQQTLPSGANPQPGTYNDFTIKCDTTMAKGVYVINGGMLSINAQNKLIGDGVMFVLKNGAGIRINGGGNVFLRPMTNAEMVDPSAGNMTATQAAQLKDMLIFEDRNSSGDNNDKINGTSDMGLNGTVYLPKSTVTFDGSTKVTFDCFVLAAARIVIQGTANMTAFCPGGGETGIVVGGMGNTVKLVS